MKPWYRNPVILLWLNAGLLAAILATLAVTQRYTVTGGGSQQFYVWDNWSGTADWCTYDMALQGYTCSSVVFRGRAR